MKEYTFEEMNVGVTENFNVTLTDEMVQTFASLSGDYNPLHVDEAFAKSRQFNSKVVYGMLVASFYSTLVGMWLPGKEALLQEINIKFRKPVYVGDELIISGSVKEVDDRFKRIHIKAEIKNQYGEKVSSATIFCGFSNQLRRAE